MKILVVIDYWLPNIGGGPINVAEIATRIQHYRGSEIFIVTSNLYLDKRMERSNLYSELQVFRLGMTASYYNIFARLAFLWSLFIFLWRSEFDILHVHPYAPLLVCWFIAAVKRKPMIITVHLPGKEISGVRTNKLILLFFQILDRLITYYLPYNAQIFVDKHLVNQRSFTKKRFYIPNGVNLEKFDLIKASKSKVFQFLFVGRFHPQKNLTSLISAFGQVAKDKNIALILVGEGEQKTELESLTSKLRLGKKIKILTPVYGDQLIRLYKSSHLFVLPSLYEGFPLTVLEAWAAKIPVLTTPTGMLKKLIRDGRNGIVIKQPTIKEIRLGLLKALDSKNLSRMGEAGYRLVKKYYTWDEAAKKTYLVYKRVIRQ